MGYLDDLGDIFGIDDMDFSDPDTPAVEFSDSPLDIARRQLDGMRAGFREEPEGTFTASGTRFGCGYAEACAVVDPVSGRVAIDIDSHLRVAPEHAKGTRKLFRRLNQGFIIKGLVLDDDNTVHFRPETPCDLTADDDLSEFIGKGFSTIHANAHVVAQLAAGRAPWDILHEDDEDDEEEGEGMLDRLRRLMERQ